MKGETREERFVRIAERRVQNVLAGIRSLSQCANPKVYAWDEKQLSKIWDAIDREVTRCRQSFEDPDAGTFRF